MNVVYPSFHDKKTGTSLIHSADPATIWQEYSTGTSWEY